MSNGPDPMKNVSSDFEFKVKDTPKLENQTEKLPSSLATSPKNEDTVKSLKTVTIKEGDVDSDLEEETPHERDYQFKS